MGAENNNNNNIKEEGEEKGATFSFSLYINEQRSY
jgi:hypothetical protein